MVCQSLSFRLRIRIGDEIMHDFLWSAPCAPYEGPALLTMTATPPPPRESFRVKNCVTF